MGPEDILKILKSLSTNLPVMRSWGITFPKLIRIQTSPDCVSNVIDSLSNISSGMIYSDATKKEAAEIFDKVSSGFIFILRTGKENPYEESALERIRAGKLSGFPVVIDCIERVQGLENYFNIVIDKVDCGIISDSEVVPKEAELSLVYDTIRKYVGEEVGAITVEKALKAATCFLYPMHRDTFDSYIDTVSSLVDFDESFLSVDGVPEVFVKCLKNWFSTNRPNIYEVPNGPREGETDFLVYDSHFVYISEERFCKLMESFGGLTAQTAVKCSLRDNGLLIPNEGDSCGFTVKISLKLSGSQQSSRVRLLKFSIKEIESILGCGFEEILF